MARSTPAMGLSCGSSTATILPVFDFSVPWDWLAQVTRWPRRNDFRFAFDLPLTFISHPRLLSAHVAAPAFRAVGLPLFAQALLELIEQLRECSDRGDHLAQPIAHHL